MDRINLAEFLNALTEMGRACGVTLVNAQVVDMTDDDRPLVYRTDDAGNLIKVPRQ